MVSAMLRSTHALLALSSLVLAATACTDTGSGDGALTTPRSTIDAPLAGPWFTGSLSSIQYYDSSSNTWLDPSGEGFFFVFDGDGGYETGAIIDSLVAGCEMRLLGDEVGTVTVDGADLTVYRHRISTHITNTCGHDGDRTQGELVYHLTWSIDRDADGLEWLSLTHDDGSVEGYRRWTE